MRPPVSHHLEQSPPRVSVLEVFPEVRGKRLDPLGKDGNLDLRRASVLLVDLGPFDNALLSLSREH